MRNASLIARTAAATAGLAIVLAPLSASAMTMSRKPPVPITLPLYFASAHNWQPADDTAHEHRWRRHRVGDDTALGILGGLAVIGTIGVLASAIDKDQQRRRGERSDGRYYYRDSEWRDGAASRGAPEGGDPSDVRDSAAADRAVSACTAEAGKTARVDEVFAVERAGGEWRVEGDFADGRGFRCSVDANGRAYVGLGDQAKAGWDDEPRAVAQPDPSDDRDDRYATGREPDFNDPRH